MKNSQLISILKKFSKKELFAFQRYLKGIGPNKRQLHQVLEYLIKCYPKFDADKLTMETVHQALFKEPHSGKKLNNLLSDLKLLATEFLLWKHQKEHPLEQALTLVQILYKRGMNKVAAIAFRDLEKRIDGKEQALALDFYQLIKFKYFQLDAKNDQNPIKSNILQQAHLELNTYYLTNSCKLFCELINRKNIFNEEGTKDRATIQQLLNSDLATKPSILLACYQKTLAMLLDNAEKHYHTLKQLFFKHYDTFNLEDQHTLLLYLINFCIPKVMQGIKEYEKDALTLHEFGFTNKILQNGGLNKTIFLNAVTIGCRLRQCDWVEKLINENASFINDSDPKNIQLMAKAMLAIEQEQYLETIEFLRETPFSDIDNSLRARGMLAKCYYKAPNRDNLFLLSHLKNFEAYLYNNPQNLSNAVKKRYLSFIKIMRLLMRPNKNNTRIREKINAKSSEIYAKKFLLKQVS